MFGYKEEEVLEKSIEMILRREDIRELQNSAEVQYNFELTAKHKNRSKILISATVTPLLSPENLQSKYYLLIARDITHAHKFEEEVALKYQKVKEAYEELGLVKRHSDYVFELLQLSSEHQDMKMIADFVVSSVIMLTRVDGCVMRVCDEQKKTLELVSSFGVDQDWQGKKSLKFKGSLAEKAFRQLMPLKIIDLTKESKYQSKFLAKKMNFCSLLLIPLVFQGKCVGSLSLYTTPEKKLEIFENEFIEKYAQVIQVMVWSQLCLKNFASVT